MLIFVEKRNMSSRSIVVLQCWEATTIAARLTGVVLERLVYLGVTRCLGTDLIIAQMLASKKMYVLRNDLFLMLSLLANFRDSVSVVLVAHSTAEILIQHIRKLCRL